MWESRARWATGEALIHVGYFSNSDQNSLRAPTVGFLDGSHARWEERDGFEDETPRKKNLCAGKAGLPCIYALGVLVVRSQVSKITELTWVIRSMLTTVCLTPRPMSAGRNPQHTHTETTGTRCRHTPHRERWLTITIISLNSALIFTVLFVFVFLNFQRTLISKWRFWRRGIHIHRNGCQNSHGEKVLLRRWQWTCHLISPVFHTDREQPHVTAHYLPYI